MIRKQHSLDGKFIRILLCIAVSVCFVTNNANAVPAELQNTVQQVSPANAAEVIQAEQQPTLEIPNAPIKITNRKSKESAISTGGKPIKFVLGGVMLHGNVKIPTRELKQFYANKINTTISIAELSSIAQDITEYYRNAGYILAQAILPEQTISKQGIVEIQIVEGYIDKVQVHGCESKAVCTMLKKYGEQIKKERPLTLATLERFSFLANDLPGVQVRTILNKSDNNLGATELNFVVNEKKFSGYAAFNDYNSTVLGRQQYLFNASMYNILFSGQTSLQANIGRYNDRLKYFALNHTQQLNSNGLGGNFSISDIKTKPNMQALGSTELITPGEAVMFSLGFDYAWIKSHAKNFDVGASFDFTNSHTNIGEAILFQENIRTLSLFGTYGFLYGSRTYTRFTLTLTQGLEILSASANPPARIGEKLNFTKLELTMAQAYRFSYRKLSYYFSFHGQYAFNIVPSSETICYGGILYGAGYDPASIAGDRGFTARLELQHSALTQEKIKLTSQIFIFGDTGYIWDINKAMSPNYEYGSSAGVGCRANVLKHLMFDLTLAQPFNPSIALLDKGYLRILFNIKLYV